MKHQSCLGWGSHSLAPLSFRAATYSGVFTLLPMLIGKGRIRTPGRPVMDDSPDSSGPPDSPETSTDPGYRSATLTN